MWVLLFEEKEHVSYRICAPGGLATALLADGDREETERAGASESDWELVDMRGQFVQKKEAGK